MALILCHAVKGGGGSSFIAAQVALGLARRGLNVAALDLTGQDALKRHFGVALAEKLPDLDVPTGRLVAGVSLWAMSSSMRARLLADGAFALPFLLDDETVFIADVAPNDHALRERLKVCPWAQVCILEPTAPALTALPLLEPDIPLVDVRHTVFVLNQFDETRRFARHAYSFLRELLGSRFIGVVRRDEAVNEASAMCERLECYAPGSAALADVALLLPAIEDLIANHAGAATDG